jgi:hypothetical protein
MSFPKTFIATAIEHLKSQVHAVPDQKNRRQRSHKAFFDWRDAWMSTVR